MPKTLEKTEKPKVEKYSFDEANHIHKLGDKPLIGVTTALGVIAKPALVQWSANMAVSYVIEKSEPYYGPDNDLKDHYVVNGEILAQAKVSHRTKKETAGDWGTNLHKAIEEWIKGKKLPALDFEALQAFVKFMFWAEKEEVKFLESEKHVWSRELWIGGICDLVVEIKGKKYIADIKTSSGIYNEAFFQMGAYDLCLKEMGESDGIAGYVVINLKKDGSMDMKTATDMELNRQAFKSALALHKIINSLK